MVCVFARKTSEPLASLVKQIDQKIGENHKLKSFVVIMPKEGEQDGGRTQEAGDGCRRQARPTDDGENPADLPTTSSPRMRISRS